MWVGELISEFLMGKEEKKVERREQREEKQKERVVGRTPDGPRWSLSRTAGNYHFTQAPPLEGGLNLQTPNEETD